MNKQKFTISYRYPGKVKLQYRHVYATSDIDAYKQAAAELIVGGHTCYFYKVES